MFFDSHCHLTSDQLAPDFDAVLERARAADVTAFLNIGDDLDASRSACSQAETASERGFLCGASVGVHPQNALSFAHEYSCGGTTTIQALRELASHPRACAVGEIGLDFVYDDSHPQFPGATRDVQEQVFRAQLELAIELSLPVVIHNREADEALLAVAHEYSGRIQGGVFHCFGSSLEVARQVLDMGFHLGFGGIVTFKNAESVRDAARFCPLDRMLIETDAPYLAPVPHRGKTNEPSFVPLVTQTIAPLKNISIEELAAITTRNAQALFALS